MCVCFGEMETILEIKRVVVVRQMARKHQQLKIEKLKQVCADVIT